MKKLIVFIFLLGVANISWSSPVTWSGNGNQYQVVDLSNISWANSRAGALSLGNGWDLVTITSLEEQNFVASLLPTANGSLVEYYTGGVFLGGAWGWITGEAFSFEYWGAGEPNGNAYEPYMALDGRFNVPNWGWNDYTGAGVSFIAGYVAERHTSAVPAPATFWLFITGIIGLLGFRNAKLVGHSVKGFMRGAGS